MDRYGTGPGSFGAAFWIPDVKTEKTAKKRRKKRQKWARYSHLKRVRVADLLLMDRYLGGYCSPHNRSTVINAYGAQALDALAAIATALGETQDAARSDLIRF